MNRKVVYISGPYSSDPALNVGTAARIGNVFIDMGYAPIVPHLSHFQHMFYPQEYKVWIEVDLSIMKGADAVYRFEGESPGAAQEVAHAHDLGIPVFYDIMDAIKYLKSLEAEDEQRKNRNAGAGTTTAKADQSSIGDSEERPNIVSGNIPESGQDRILFQGRCVPRYNEHKTLSERLDDLNKRLEKFLSEDPLTYPSTPKVRHEPGSRPTEAAWDVWG